jgi:hypothetical protein
MQTFLPFADYRECAHVLDRARLGKQRVECRQLVLLNVQGPTVSRDPETGRPLWWIFDAALEYPHASTPWYNHPVARLWRGFEVELCFYGMAMCIEWVNRGYEDAQFSFFAETADRLLGAGFMRARPSWHCEKAYSFHRGVLLGKAPEHYGKFGWTEVPLIGAKWPEFGPLAQ